MLNRITLLTLYSTSCWCLNSLLLAHYYTQCRTSIWTFIFPESAYCSMVHAALQALQCSPLVVAAPMLLSHKFGSDYYLRPSQKDDHAAETKETCESSL
jgi:hypothetical protein